MTNALICPAGNRAGHAAIPDAPAPERRSRGADESTTTTDLGSSSSQAARIPRKTSERLLIDTHVVEYAREHAWIVRGHWRSTVCVSPRLAPLFCNAVDLRRFLPSQRIRDGETLGTAAPVTRRNDSAIRAIGLRASSRQTPPQRGRSTFDVGRGGRGGRADGQRFHQRADDAARHGELGQGGAGSAAGRDGAGTWASTCASTVADAQERVRRALDHVGSDHAGVLIDVCCLDQGLEEVERSRGWPARSGRVVLGIALDRLARHYGIVAEGPSRGKVGRWGTGDDKPTLDAWRQ